MEIVYKDIHEFKKEDLESLFLSVEWSSGHYPDKLVVAMQNFETVYTAWDGDQLVGLICAMDDGIMTAYVHYLLVRPEYQPITRSWTSMSLVDSRKPTMQVRCLSPVFGLN